MNPHFPFAPYNPSSSYTQHHVYHHGVRPSFAPTGPELNTFTETMYDSQPVPHSDTFKIVMILDESGSMECIRESMIKAINSLIHEQSQITGREATFTLVKFNNEVKRVIENKPLSEIKQLTFEDYKPNGSTALFDALGDTISWFRNEKEV